MVNDQSKCHPLENQTIPTVFLSTTENFVLESQQHPGMSRTTDIENQPFTAHMICLLQIVVFHLFGPTYQTSECQTVQALRSGRRHSMKD